MNINAERFFALTALLAAPLVTASACVITSSDGDGETGGETGTASMTASTDPSVSTTMTSADTTVSTTDATTTTPDPDSTGTDDGTGTDEGTSTDTGTTGGVDLGNCCAPEGIAGCEVPDVEACVCAVDPFCCEEEWDNACAVAVNENDCGECVFAPQPFDCSCIGECDGKPAPQSSQVCGADPDSAAAAGLAECQAQLDAICEVASCESCECFTAEIPDIDCK